MESMEKDEIINFLNGIMNNNTPTPRTRKFDRDFGQESNRWWDEIGEDNEKYSSQKYHIHGTFLCVTHHNWKIPKNCKKGCAECYKEDGCNPENNELFREKEKGKGSLKDKYYNMQKPEMYLWFVEAFKMAGEKEEELFKCVCCEWKETKSIKNVRDILVKFNITWEEVLKEVVKPDVQDINNCKKD